MRDVEKSLGKVPAECTTLDWTRNVNTKKGLSETSATTWLSSRCPSIYAKSHQIVKEGFSDLGAARSNWYALELRATNCLTSFAATIR